MKRIESHRLGYKKIREDSYGFLKNFFSRKDTTRYLPLGRPYSDNEVKEYIQQRMLHWQKNDFGLYLLYLKTTDECIGYCGLEYVDETDFVDLRYGLVMKHWGKGFAKEAAEKCLEYGFTALGLKTIYGVAVPDNRASIAVLMKLGMRQVDSLKFYDDDVKYFQIDYQQWQHIAEQDNVARE